MSDRLSRRDAIRTGLFAASSAFVGSNILVADARAAQPATKSGGLRFVHMTDMHVQPELRRRALFDDLHARGNTIILVTHEPDIAEYAHRVVHIRDGMIASDAVSSRGRTVKAST